MTKTDTTMHVGQELGLADIITLLGHHTLTSIMQKPVGATKVTNHHLPPAVAAAFVDALPASDIWYGINEVATLPTDNRRATERTVGRWCALWADLDEGHGKSGDYDTINAIIDDITDAYGTEPTYITVSGHGVQPVWILDPTDPATTLDTDTKRVTAVALLKRHGRLVQASAAARGVKADSVFDLPRVLRAPGTTNWKDPANPVATSAMRATGAPLTVADLEAALTRAGIHPMDSDHPASGEVVSAPSTWQYRGSGQQQCGYADDMVRGWASDHPAARHPWLVAQATRIAAARRHGCFTGADAAAAERELGTRFTTLCARGGDTRPVSRFEVEQAIRYGQDLVATMTDGRVAEELGNHEHRDYAAEQAYLQRSAHELDHLRALGAHTGPPTPTVAPQVTDTVGGDMDEAAPPAPPTSPPAAVAVAHTVLDPEELYVATVEQIEGAYDFWSSRPSLHTIWRAAAHGEASPWAVLGIVLVRIIAAVPHNVYLPAMGRSGRLGSLNLFLGIAADSGGGKGVATGVAESLYKHPAIFDAPPGSGEGMGHLFGGMVTDKETKQTDFQWTRRSVLIDAPEIDSLSAIGGRNGSTSDSILRQAFSGETLGFSYAGQGKRLRIPGGQYRLTMMVGVQPERAGGLFAGAGGGTPQRFLWLPAEDHRIGDPDPDDSEIPDLHPYRPEWWHDGHVMEVCDTARAEQLEERRRRGRRISVVPRADVDESWRLDSQAVYARTKVAAALGILDGRDHVNEEDWELSGCIAAMSTLVRSGIVDVVDAARLRDAEKRGQERGAEQIGAKVTAQEIDGARIAETEQRVMRIVGQHDGAVPRRDVLSGVSKAQRPYVQTALDSLTENGLLEREEIESTRKGGRPGVLYKVVRA